MLKKIVTYAKKVCWRLLLPVAEWIIKLDKLSFYEFYHNYRVNAERTLQGMSYDEFLDYMKSDIEMLEDYPECYRWFTEAATLAWKFYNT